MEKRLIIFLLCLAGALSASYAQKITLTGHVSDADDGNEMIGVTVRVVGAPDRATVTDINGDFAISVSPDEKLQFSYIGYREQTIVVSNSTPLDVKMLTDNGNLEEVVVVGYGQAKRLTLTGAVSAVNGKELQKVPVSSVQNSMVGKLPGFFSQQRSGQPGKDASDFFIRGVSSLNGDGNKPLIVVDDVEYTYEQLSQINVNEIESISILKDASTTAIYGIKGANGVLVVKTRRGEEGKPKINVRLETGIQTPVRTPNFLNSYETAQLVNEAYGNDGLQPRFTEAELNHFRTGDLPYSYPNVSWYDEVFKDMASQQNFNIDVSGGSKRLKYFVSAGYFSQNGLVKDFDSGDDLNSNYRYRRFNYRTNLDFQVTDNLQMRLDVTSRFMNINEPRNMNATGEIYNFSRMHPYSAPVQNPDGSYSYLHDTDNAPTLNARLANEGYKRTRRNDNNVLYSVNWNMDFITKGLSSNARIAYSTIDETYRSVGRSTYPTYWYDETSDLYTINPDQHYTKGIPLVNGWTGPTWKTLNVMAFVNYARVFNDKHDVGAMLLYNLESKTQEDSGEKVPSKFTGFTTKLSYKYKQRYLVDLNMAYNGSDRFHGSHRYGLFPALGLGWAVSEEKWFKDIFGGHVDLLKIRSSYGLVGSDVASGGRYLYNQVYEKGNGYRFGESSGPQEQPGYREGSLGNDNVSWEKARKFDIGIDLNLWNSLSLTFDYFYDRRYDQLVTRADVPLILGIGVSPYNVGKTENKGFDGQIGYRKTFGNFMLNTNFVFSYAKNKIIYMAEGYQAYPWLAQTGRPIGQQFGYTWIGYYTPEDIAKIQSGSPDAPAVPNADMPIQAGDLKYADLNGDGIIDHNDRGAIGKPNLPNTTLGWTIGGSWKGFTLSVLFQGSFNYSFSVVGTGIEPFKSQFQPLHLERWTEERYLNGENIAFPRLTSNPSTINSAEAYMSNFWLVDAWYIRLKTIDLSYDLPKKWVPRFMDGVRFYVNAYNLFTWTSYDKYQQDPEISTNSAGDAYMNQRVVNFGVSLSL